jgi:hypothetical protein
MDTGDVDEDASNVLVLQTRLLVQRICLHEVPRKRERERWDSTRCYSTRMHSAQSSSTLGQAADLLLSWARSAQIRAPNQQVFSLFFSLALPRHSGVDVCAMAERSERLGRVPEEDMNCRDSRLSTFSPVVASPLLSVPPLTFASALLCEGVC